MPPIVRLCSDSPLWKEKEVVHDNSVDSACFFGVLLVCRMMCRLETGERGKRKWLLVVGAGQGTCNSSMGRGSVACVARVSRFWVVCGEGVFFYDCLFLLYTTVSRFWAVVEPGEERGGNVLGGDET